jgi:hypothetical protein
MRMKRRLLNLPTFLSLLLCVAVAAWGVRSLFVTDRFFRSSFVSRGQWTDWVQDEVQVGRGGVGFGRVVQSETGGDYQRRMEALLLKYGGRPLMYERRAPAYPDLKVKGTPPRLGFKYDTFENSRPTPSPRSNRGLEVVVPLWVILPWFAALPAWRGWRWWRRRRQYGAGLCPRCGYDLRATPEQCPECGTAPTPTPGA